MKQGILRNMAWGPMGRLLVLAAAAGLAACGGGGDAGGGTVPPPAATRLSGTAAVGAPIAGGAVQVRCSGGNLLESVTGANGSWSVDTTGQSLPCAVRVAGGSLGAGPAFHSVALSFDTLNITPLTDLIVANATGKLPAVWWGASGPADLGSLVPAQVEKALTSLRGALGLAALQTFDPRTVTFAAAPRDKVDDVLEALQQALATLGMDYASLAGAASGTTFTLSEGFRIALGNAHTMITVGGGGSSGGNGGGNNGNNGNNGTYTLTLNVNAGGVLAPPVTITNVPKPSTQAEFCGEIASPSSGIGLTQAVPGGSGTLTINNCSFSGSGGSVSATLSLTAPIAMTVPYTVTYTYN